MRVAEVVSQLSVLLPKYTDRFSDNSAGVSAISATTTVATIDTTSAHGLAVGSPVTLANVLFQNSITAVSQDGLVFTFETDVPHDLTLDWQNTVTLSGFTDSAWNGEQSLLAVPNRNTFEIQSAETIPTLTGAELLLEERSDGVNGRFPVTSVDSTTQVTVEGGFLAGDYSDGSISTATRVAGISTSERLKDEYTRQELDGFWAFVEMHDIVTSKSRDAYSDAVSTLPSGTDARTRQMDGFTIYIAVNTSEELTGVGALDICRHELIGPIYKSVFGARFESGLSGSGDFRVVPLLSGIHDYDRAVYIHRYDFQMPFEVTDDDTVDPGNTRAFRDIDFTQNVGQNELTTVINLDDEPE